MKRQDIEVGIEYAATAPLAYGREPNTTARRVRFTSNQAGPWVRIITMERRADQRWETIDTKVVRLAESAEAASLPTSLRDAFVAKWGHDEPVTRKTIGGKAYEATHRTIDTNVIPVGGQVTFLDDTAKGGLPGEVYRQNHDTGKWDWVPTLVMPADIHRTWAEVEAEAEARHNREVEYDQAAKVPELRALLSQVGLAGTFRVSRSGSGSKRVAIESLGRDGDALLAELTTWAQDRGLIAKVEA